MARVPEVSRGGFYAWLERLPSKRAREDERLKVSHTGGPYQNPRDLWGEASTASKSIRASCGTSPDDAAIVSAIITMAHSLGIRVVAEGVESREQIEFLRRQGCDFLQGYYFSPPRPVDEMDRVLKNVKLT